MAEAFDRQAFQGRRVLVTGGSGFIAAHLTRALVESGAEVSSLALEAAAVPGIARQFVGDLADTAFVDAALADAAPWVVFHLAAAKARSSETAAFRPAIETNLLGSLSVMTAAERTQGLASIVLVGTAEEYGSNPYPFREDMREHPVSAYSFSKLCMTQLAETLYRLHGLPAVVLRPTVAYGPGQPADMFLPALIDALAHGREFPMTPGMQTRDFIYVTDLVDALLRAALSPGARGRTVNVGSGEPVTISALAAKVEAILGAEGLARPGAIAYREGEVMEYGSDISLAQDLLGWSPTVTLDEGLRLTIDAMTGRRTTGSA